MYWQEGKSKFGTLWTNAIRRTSGIRSSSLVFRLSNRKTYQILIVSISYMSTTFSRVLQVSVPSCFVIRQKKH